MNPYTEMIKEAAHLPFSAWDVIEEINASEVVVRTTVRGLSVIAIGVLDCGELVEIMNIEMEQEQ